MEEFSSSCFSKKWRRIWGSNFSLRKLPRTKLSDPTLPASSRKIATNPQLLPLTSIRPLVWELSQKTSAHLSKTHQIYSSNRNMLSCWQRSRRNRSWRLGRSRRMVANPFQTPPVMILIAHLALVAVQVHLLQIGRKIVQEAVPPSHHRPILLLDRAQIVHLPNRQDPNSSKLIHQRVKIVTN